MDAPMDIDFADLLMEVVHRKASDLHLSSGAHPTVRVRGKLSPLEEYPKLSSSDTREIVYSILTGDQRQRLETNWQLDFAYSIPGHARFRVNAYYQRGAIGAAFRLIPFGLTSIDELGLPETVHEFTRRPRGFVLVTGPTGSGKSTTLAAMIDEINSTRDDHILTIEDPIEFLHDHKRCLVNQRELGTDATSFADALRAGLRQDPDVILVGEMRDLETISTALTAAETGHLVLSTLHTLDATETIQRIIAVFPPPEQKQIRLQLAATLKAVVSQRLVRRADDKGRVPAVEVMIATNYIRDCIINADKPRLIRDAIAAGTSQYGMQTFAQSLFDLYTKNLITLDEALLRASNAAEFNLRIQGVRSASDSAREEMERQMVDFERYARK